MKAKTEKNLAKGIDKKTWHDILRVTRKLGRERKVS